MIVGRRLADICRDLAETAHASRQEALAQLLRMAALQAATADLHCDDPVALKDSLVGVWDWDVANDRVYTDGRFAAMFGVHADEAASGMPLHVWLDAIHPDDVASVSDGIEEALRGRVFSKEYRVICNGETHWVYARGKCTIDKTGKVVRFPGAIVDITQEKSDDVHLSIAPF
jgi:PAS domain S-box-containing protein